MREGVLVTGGNGLLGTKMLELLLARGRAVVSASQAANPSNRHLGEFPYFALDVTDSTAVSELILRLRPAAVVHAAAFTGVDACESRRDLCWRVNVEGAANVASACHRVGVRMIHLSTEYVFDGSNGPYTEEDQPNPVGFYGLTKLQSEKAVQERCEDWVIARTTILFGHAPNLRPNFLLWLIDRLAHGERVQVVDDQIGSPTLADNLAEMLLPLLDSCPGGIYNTAGDSIVDRYSFSAMAAERFELDPNLIDRVKTRELHQLAPRPLKAGLIMDKFKSRFPETRVLTASEAVERLRCQMADIRTLRLTERGFHGRMQAGTHMGYPEDD